MYKIRNWEGAESYSWSNDPRLTLDLGLSGVGWVSPNSNLHGLVINFCMIRLDQMSWIGDWIDVVDEGMGGGYQR